MIKIIQNRKFFYYLSGALFILSLLIISTYGVRLGIDFTGGSLLEIRYTEDRPSPEDLNNVLSDLEISSVQIQAVEDHSYLLRLPHIEDQTRRDIMASLREQIGDTSEGSSSSDSVSIQEVSSNSELIEGIELGLDNENEGTETEGNNILIEERFETIGPVIGQELKSKSIQAILVVLFAILVYIAWAFRKVSWPVKSWKYGSVALVTLFHDVIIVLGIYTVLTHIYGWELNTAFVAAILTIVGYSVNDTIVVFDRIRENLPRISGDFEEVVNISVNQTLSRSLITSLTTLLVLLAILVIGGTTIQSFVAALCLGVVVGTYSSIFVASPLLVSLYTYAKNK